MLLLIAGACAPAGPRPADPFSPVRRELAGCSWSERTLPSSGLIEVVYTQAWDDDGLPVSWREEAGGMTSEVTTTWADGCPVGSAYEVEDVDLRLVGDATSSCDERDLSVQTTERWDQDQAGVVTSGVYDGPRLADREAYRDGEWISTNSWLWDGKRPVQRSGGGTSDAWTWDGDRLATSVHRVESPQAEVQMEYVWEGRVLVGWDERSSFNDEPLGQVIERRYRFDGDWPVALEVDGVDFAEIEVICE